MTPTTAARAEALAIADALCGTGNWAVSHEEPRVVDPDGSGARTEVYVQRPEAAPLAAVKRAAEAFIDAGYDVITAFDQPLTPFFTAHASGCMVSVLGSEPRSRLTVHLVKPLADQGAA